jgi:hypothetical protein
VDFEDVHLGFLFFASLLCGPAGCCQSSSLSPLSGLGPAIALHPFAILLAIRPHRKRAIGVRRSRR